MWRERVHLYITIQYCGSGMFISDPRSELFHPGSGVLGQKALGFRIPDPGPRKII
jgi:hypothetical protein